MEDGEPYLAGTARPALARLSAATAAEIGLPDGGLLRVTGEGGSVSLPAVITEMPDRVVWLPANGEGTDLRRALGVGAGALVELEADKRAHEADPTNAGSEK
ncbi:Molybdopterin dinucleotide-binding domain-containing protein [Nocardiopsis rhodophaea]